MSKKRQGLRISVGDLRKELKPLHDSGTQTIAFGVNTENNAMKMVLGVLINDKIQEVNYEFSLKTAIHLRDMMTEVIGELQKKVN